MSGADFFGSDAGWSWRAVGDDKGTLSFVEEGESIENGSDRADLEIAVGAGEGGGSAEPLWGEVTAGWEFLPSPRQGAPTMASRATPPSSSAPSFPRG
jgi:hypothetical protein